ncbi:MAG: hypothetical protein M3373_04410 [Gemmatimonadota bacterium]|nr:hypothetical protein [Gemmatimonadota bacterium]
MGVVFDLPECVPRISAGLYKLLGVLALGLAAAALLGGCQEDLGGGAACPALCPEQVLEVRDTIISPVSLDTTLFAYPPFGGEPLILLARRGDTLVTAAALRFDSLHQHITAGAGDIDSKRIVEIDTASVAFSIADTTLVKDSVTFEVYDIDAPATDPDTAVVRTLFTPERLLSTRTLPRDSVADSVRISVPASFVLARVLAAERVRLGIAIRSDSSVAIRIVSSDGGLPPRLSYLARAVSTDTQTVTVSVNTPEPPNVTDVQYNDYQVVIAQPSVGSPALLAIGGLPGRRTYLRFDIPSRILDSTTVVRATLLLTQAPNRGFAPADSLRIVTRIVLAGRLLDPEPGKAALLLAEQSFGPPTITVALADSGTTRIELAGVLRAWRAQGDDGPTRALLLQAADEGSGAGIVFFFSTEAADPTLRPRLQLSYVPRAGFGLP